MSLEVDKNLKKNNDDDDDDSDRNTRLHSKEASLLYD